MMKKEETQTLMESMTRMFPMTVIKLRDPATRTMSTISTVVYGLAEKRLASPSLLVLVAWNEFRVSILADSGSPSHRCFRLESCLYQVNTHYKPLENDRPLCGYSAVFRDVRV